MILAQTRTLWYVTPGVWYCITVKTTLSAIFDRNNGHNVTAFDGHVQNYIIIDIDYYYLLNKNT